MTSKNPKVIEVIEVIMGISSYRPFGILYPGTEHMFYS